jgi:hypothetical protein
MENDKNKPFTLTPEKMGELSINIQPEQTYYKVNVDKIKTIKDIKLILKHLNLNYKPKSKEDFEELKHLLILD